MVSSLSTGSKNDSISDMLEWNARDTFDAPNDDDNDDNNHTKIVPFKRLSISFSGNVQ